MCSVQLHELKPLIMTSVKWQLIPVASLGCFIRGLSPRHYLISPEYNFWVRKKYIYYLWNALIKFSLEVIQLLWSLMLASYVERNNGIPGTSQNKVA